MLHINTHFKAHELELYVFSFFSEGLKIDFREKVHMEHGKIQTWKSNSKLVMKTHVSFLRNQNR